MRKSFWVNFLNFFSDWHNFTLVLILLTTFALHIALINYPNQPIFDETYYVNDARSIIAGNGSERAEHPPLGKLLFAAGIFAFGDNPMGWRLFPILFGTAGIALFYLICLRLRLPRGAALFAVFLLAFDNMSFVQSSVAMLDVFSVTFMLLAFWLYIRENYLLSGLSIALSALAKVSGVMALVAILLHWLVARRNKKPAFIGSLASVPLLFAGLMALFLRPISGRFISPVEPIRDIMNLSGSLTFANTSHPSASRPWEWITSPDIMPFWYDPHYLSIISYTIWVLIIPAVVFLVYLARKGNDAAVFGVSWFAATYALWIPLSLATNRISYVFYFYPTVGAVCLGLALGAARLFEGRGKLSPDRLKEAAAPALAGYCALHLAIFLVLSPVTSPVISLKLW